MKYNIAVIQLKISDKDPRKNIENIELFIKKAKEQNAQVVVLPEDCVTYSIFGGDTAEDKNNENIEIFKNLARTYSIDIVCGSWLEKTGEGSFNTSYYIDAKGEVLAKYRKNHLYLSELDKLTPGKDFAVFDTAYGRAGIIICWDILHAELFERMKQAGVEIIYCPSYWWKEISGKGAEYNTNAEETLIDAICVSRAIEYNVVFVYVNAGGVIQNADGTKDTLIGHSQITQPFFGTLKKLDHAEEEMFVQEVGNAVLSVSKEIYRHT